MGYFHSGSESFSGDACEVKVAAPSLSPSAEAEYWRIRAMAQQVLTDVSGEVREHFKPGAFLYESTSLPPSSSQTLRAKTSSSPD